MSASIIDGHYTYKTLYSLKKDGTMKEWQLLCTIINSVQYDKDGSISKFKFEEQYLIDLSKLTSAYIYGCYWSRYRNGPNHKWQQSEYKIVKKGNVNRTIIEQMLLDSKSMFDDKVKSGFKIDKDALVNSIGMGPIYAMKQHIYLKHKDKVKLPAWICEGWTATEY